MRWVTLLLLGTFFAASSCKDNKRQKPAPDQRSPPPSVTDRSAASPTQAIAPPRVPSAEGKATRKALAELVDELALRREPDAERAVIDGLRLPDTLSFFTETFGAPLADQLDTEYRSDPLLKTLAKTIRYNQGKHGRRKVSIERFDSATDRGATGLQARAFKAMKSKIPLYSVRLSAPGQAASVHFSSFVHDGRQFRYIGSLKALADGADDATIRRLKRRQRDSREEKGTNTQ